MLWTKATGVMLALVAVVAVNWVVMAIFIAADATDLTLAGLTGGTVHLLALGLAFAAIALSVAAASGRPGLGSSVADGIAVVAYLTTTMLPIAGLDTWARLSPWYYYVLASDPLRGGANLADLGIFATIRAGPTTGIARSTTMTVIVIITGAGSGIEKRLARHPQLYSRRRPRSTPHRPPTTATTTPPTTVIHSRGTGRRAAPRRWCSGIVRL